MAETGNILKLLQEFLPLLDKFSEEHKDQSVTMRDFTLWLFRGVSYKHHDMLEDELHDFKNPAGDAPLDMQLLYLVTHLNRFSGHYIKKALDGSDFVRPDDFHFLAMLGHTESMTKSELIYSNITTMPSGIEVIKRLLKADFIEEFDDPNDKRSKRVRITKTGMDRVMKTADEMAKAGKIFSSDLSNEEKLSLISILDKMNKTHTKSFETSRTKNLDTLVNEKYSNE